MFSLVPTFSVVTFEAAPAVVTGRRSVQVAFPRRGNESISYVS